MSAIKLFKNGEYVAIFLLKAQWLAVDKLCEDSLTFFGQPRFGLRK